MEVLSASDLAPDPNAAIPQLVYERWSNERFEEVGGTYQTMVGALPEAVCTVNITPIAAAQEPPANLIRLLDLHAQQDMPTGSYGSLLSFNYVGGTPANLGRLLEVVEEAPRRWPNLPVAAATTAYDCPVSIASHRSLAWDVAIFHAYAHAIQHTITGISSDVDLWHTRPSHARSFTKAVEGNDHFCYGGPTRFGLVGKMDTTINRLLRYRNFAHVLYDRLALGTLYEHNMALSLGRYAMLGSWGSQELAEAKGLLQNLNYTHQHTTDDESRQALLRYYRMVPEAANVVSPRRMLPALVNWFHSREFEYNFRTDNSDTARDMPTNRQLELARFEPTPEALVAHTAWFTHLITAKLTMLVESEAQRQRVPRLLRTARHIIGLPVDLPEAA